MLVARNQSGDDAHDRESSALWPALSCIACCGRFPILWVVLTIVFFMMRSIGGEPVQARAAARSLECGLGEVGEHQPPAIHQNQREKYGLDLPWYQQYGNYLKGVVTLDFGPSLSFRYMRVTDIIKQMAPRSVQLVLLAFAWAILIGIPVGILAALRPGSVFRLRRPRPHRPRHLAAQLPRRDAAHLLRVGEARPAPDVGLGQRLAEQGAADSHPEPRSDGVLRTAPARHVARDPGKRLRTDGPRKGSVAEAHRRRPRAQELVAAPDHRRRPDVRCDGHRLVHRREHLLHPRHLEVLRRLGGRPRLHGGHGCDDRACRPDHLPEPARGHRPPHARPAVAREA